MSDVFMKRLLKQYAVYWEWHTIALSDADQSGQKTYNSLNPVEIKCRFEIMAMEFLDKDGNKADSNAVIWVDRDLRELGLLWPGRLRDLPHVREPFKNDGVFEIRKFDKLPSVHATQFLRICYLYRAGIVGTAGQSARKQL